MKMKMPQILTYLWVWGILFTHILHLEMWMSKPQLRPRDIRLTAGILFNSNSLSDLKYNWGCTAKFTAKINCF